MSEPTERPPSPIPVPWPFRPPYELEPSHPLYSHAQRDREQQAIEQQAGVQSRWDAEWDEFDRYYQQSRSRHRRAEQNRHHTVAPAMPSPPHQRQHGQHPYELPADSRGNPREKPTIHPATDIYGFPPGDPFYRPHLRYTPREPEHEAALREQAAMSPDKQFPPRAMGRSAMSMMQSENGYSGSHTQPIDHGSATHSRPRPPSPPPMPYRPMDMRRDQGHAGHGYPGPSRPAQQDRYQEPRYPSQPNDASTGHGHPSCGCKGYVTLTLGDEDLDLWDWSED